MRVFLHVLALLVVTRAGLPKISVRADGHYVDERRRVRLFHGFNAVMKGFPWYPEQMTNHSLVARYKSWGFNVVRLGTMWSGVEPEMGRYNETYLQILHTIVENLEAQGMYVILDMHQDVLSSKYHTYDGAPLWLVDMMPQPKHKYPWPFKSADTFEASWAKAYLTEACNVAFQGIYDNFRHSQEMFANFWRKVAQTFRHKGSVLGYELINEPWPGNIYTDPLLLIPGHAGRKNLAPMYERLASAIRQVDDKTIVMYEPVTWGILFNGEQAGTGFTGVPGGASYTDRSALSYHLYCWITSGHHLPLTPIQKVICDDIWAGDVMRVAEEEAKRTGGGRFLTEFGECDPDGIRNSSNTVLCETVLNLADKHLASWTYWDSDFYDDEGHIQQNKVSIFSRSYPRAVAGTPTHLTWDMDTATMTFQFQLDTDIPDPTEIFVPVDVHYQNGFSVDISPSLGWEFDEGNHVILVKPKTGLSKKGSLVFVNISPK